MIREIKLPVDISVSASVIRRAFQTVADEFVLTRENCPANPAFISDEKLVDLHSRGIRFFGLFIDDRQVGVVGIERLDNNDCVMEKLAVLPEYRHSGYGKRLVEFVFYTARNEGARKVLIGIIDDNHILKDWYMSFGFVEAEIKRFDHLPFTVCLMEKRL